MRIAHLADIHLGYRAYNRLTRQGINSREADVFQAFRRALDQVIAIQPDIIIIAGDLFHVVRPSNLCISSTFRAFLNLRAVTNTPVIIIGGNHDSPRSADTGCILDLLQNIPGIYIAHNEYKGITLPELDTTVFCLCHRAVPQLSSLKVEPNPDSQHNVLTIHGTMEGIAKNFYDVGQPITRSQIMHDGWDYIALGHYHVYEQLADNIYYSGSTEYTSFNIWQETDKPKGFIEFDLDERKLIKFHKVDTRDVIDLRKIDAEGITASEINQLIQQRIAGIKGGHGDKIIRLVVENAARPVLPDLDYKMIRQFRLETLHFALDLRPKKEGHVKIVDGSTRALPLEEEWREFSSNYDVPAGVDRHELFTKGLEYLGNE